MAGFTRKERHVTTSPANDCSIFVTHGIPSKKSFFLFFLKHNCLAAMRVSVSLLVPRALFGFD